MKLYNDLLTKFRPFYGMDNTFIQLELINDKLIVINARINGLWYKTTSNDDDFYSIIDTIYNSIKGL